LTGEIPQPFLDLDGHSRSDLDTLGGDIDWAADVGIDEPPHLNIDIPRFGVPAKMRSAWQRDTEATYWDANGVLQTAAPGEPRVQHEYDGSTWTPVGVLAEPQRTNREPYPRGPDDSTGEWSLSSNAGVNHDKTGIDGTANATELYSTDGNEPTFRRNDRGIPDDSTGWTFSVYIKKNRGGQFSPKSRLDQGSDQLDIQQPFDPSTGEFAGAKSGSVEEGAFKVLDRGDWWRLILTLNNNSSGNDRMQIQFRNITDLEGSGPIVDGLHVENHHAVATDGNGHADATHATMPILTGGATRSEDRLVMPVWWPQGIVSGGYYEAQQEAGGIYTPGGGNVSEAILRVGSSKAAGVGFGYDHGLADATDGTDYSSGAGADGLVTQAANTNDGAQGGQDVQRLYVLPDRTPSNVSGARHILRRLYLWPQELTEGSGGQLESLFNHDFSV